MQNRNPKKFSCAIVDDEPIAIDMLAESLSLLNKNIEVKATYSSWTKALEGMRAREYDLLFLDISINDKNGMDLLRYIPEMQSEVIFITAHPDFALGAFKFSTSGYILKPIDDLELANALDRAVNRIIFKRTAKEYQSAPFLNNKIGIPDGKSINYVRIDDIIFLEAVNSYTRIVTSNGEIISAYNIGKFKEMLDPRLFYQAHRSYIINLNRVCKYEMSGTVFMDNNKEIPVAKNAKDELLGFFTRIKAEPKSKIDIRIE
jgi:two-component system, LytTR family, response regulator